MEDMVKIRARAWRAFENLRKAIECRPIYELVWLTEKTKSPDVLKELRESMEQSQYENFMKWETMDLLAGLLEFKIAIQGLKNEGSIQVLEDEPEVPWPV